MRVLSLIHISQGGPQDVPRSAGQQEDQADAHLPGKRPGQVEGHARVHAHNPAEHGADDGHVQKGEVPADEREMCIRDSCCILKWCEHG